MKKLKTNIKVTLFVITGIALMCSLGVAYAYINQSIDMVPRTTTITSGSLMVEIDDGENLIGNVSINPGEKIEKIFSVKNTGTIDTTYNLYFSELLNNFKTPSELTYKLEPVDTLGATVNETVVPTKSSTILSNQFIEGESEHKYKLTINYANTEREQSDNVGKVFGFKLSIKEAKEVELEEIYYLDGAVVEEFPNSYHNYLPEESSCTHGAEIDFNDELWTYGINNVSNKNTSCTLKFETTYNTLVFDPNGGECSEESRSIESGTVYGPLPTPTREGYTFDGWYDTDGNQVTEATTIEKEGVTIYAHWNINSYELTVDPNTGVWDTYTAPQTYILNYQGEKEIADPTKTGYSFSGWTVSGTGATFNTETKKFKMGSSAASLTANYTINSYTLTIDPNGGSYDGSTESTTINMNYNTTQTIQTPTRSGYTFDGWEVSGGTLETNQFTIGAGNAILKAKWLINGYKWKVNHNKQNVSGSGFTLTESTSGSGDYHTTYPITDIRKNYTGFTAPNPYPTGTIEEDVKVGESGEPTVNVLNYNYARNQYNLTVKPNGGTYNNSTSNTVHTVYFEGTQNIANPTRTCYTFSGWSGDTANLSGTTYTMGTSNAEITAGWTINKYTITYNAMGGSVSPASSQVDCGSTLSLPQPVKEGFTFNGWYTQEIGGDKVDNSTVWTSSETIYAHWTINAYAVTINGVNVTRSKSGTSINYGESDTVTITPNAGYYLSYASCTNGYLNNAETGTDKTSAQTVTITNNSVDNTSVCDFEATGIQNTITLNDQGATTAGSGSITGTYGDALPSVAVPSRVYKVRTHRNDGTGNGAIDYAYYTFNGYYSEANGGGTKYINADGTSAHNWDKTGPQTLYASWTSASVTLFRASRSGYTFDGWYDAETGGNKVASGGESYTPTQDVEFYAHWTLNTSEITLDNQGATTAGSESITATYGSALPGITIPRRVYKVRQVGNFESSNNVNDYVYYVFNGYYSETNGGGTKYINADGTSAQNWDKMGNVTLYASWTSASTTLWTPTRNGFTLTGWYDAATGGNKIGDGGDSYTPTQDVEFYAHWAIQNPATPTISGATIKVYNYEDTTLTCSTTTTYTDATLYYRFGYATSAGNFNNGTYAWTGLLGSSNTLTVAKDEYRGTRYYYCEVVAYTPDRTSASGIVRSSSSYAMELRYAKLYYNATTNSGSVGITNQYVSYGSNAVFPGLYSTATQADSPPTATRTGYSFNGWYTASSGGSQVINSSGTVQANVSGWTNSSGYFIRTNPNDNNTANVLYAQFSPATYTVTLNKHGGSGGDYYVYEKYNTGYYKNSTATTQMTTSANAISTPSMDYTITFDFNYDGGPSSDYDISRYGFGGYYTGTEGSGTQYINESGYLTSSASTTNFTNSSGSLHAKWIGEMVKLLSPSREGYTFDGWYDAATGGNKIGNADTWYLPTSDITLFAHWTSKILTITLDQQSGSGGTGTIYEKYDTGYYIDSSATTQMTTSANGITTPTRSYYSFGGYYTGTNCTGTQYINYSGKLTSYATTTRFSSNGSLYACWNGNVYMVTLNKQDGSGGDDTVYEQYNTGYYKDINTKYKMTTSSNAVLTPSKSYTLTYNYNFTGSTNGSATSSYTFGGYYTGTGGSGTQYIGTNGYLTNSASTTNFTWPGNLYAKWTSASVTLPTPSREGYTFDGWYDAETGGTKIGNGGTLYTPTKDKTLYAHWTEQIQYASQIEYSNSSYTSCTDVQCAIDQLKALLS